MSVNSRPKATKIIGQRKSFYGQRIPEPCCARKETVDIDVLVTSRNGDRKIMQSIRSMSRPPSRKNYWETEDISLHTKNFPFVHSGKHYEFLVRIYKLGKLSFPK